MDRTTLFLTHLHSDHIGLTNHIATDKTRILISSVDYDYFKKPAWRRFWTWMEKNSTEKAFPETWSNGPLVNPARAYAPEYLFKAETVSDNDIFHIGDYAFRCLWTPGHTPGHTCLIWKRKIYSAAIISCLILHQILRCGGSSRFPRKLSGKPEANEVTGYPTGASGPSQKWYGCLRPHPPNWRASRPAH